VNEGVYETTFTYLAKIQPEGCVEFIESFTITVKLSDELIEKIEDQKAREVFDNKAKEVREIKVNNEKVADITYENYELLLIILRDDYLTWSGTGVFNIMETLGVKEVNFSGEWIIVTPENALIIRDELM